MKVQCEYCQNMVEASEKTCPACGAPLPAAPAAPVAPKTTGSKPLLTGRARIIAGFVLAMVAASVLGGMLRYALMPSEPPASVSFVKNAGPTEAFSTLKSNPADARAYQDVIQYYMETGKEQQAADYARRLLKNCPDETNGQWCVDFFLTFERRDLAAQCALLCDRYTGKATLLPQVGTYTAAELLQQSPLRQAMEFAFSRQASAITLADLQTVTYLFIDKNSYYCGIGPNTDPEQLDQLIVDMPAASGDIGLVYFQGLDSFGCSGYTPDDVLSIDLESLSIPRGGDAFQDLQPLQELKRLRHLTIGGPQLQSLKGIESLSTLQSIALVHSALSDLSLLPKCKSVTSLELRDNEGLSSVASLSQMTQLRELRVSGETVVDLSPVAQLTGLTVLSVEGTKIRDTSFLTDLPNLRELHFLDNEQVSQLPPLKSARKLETLYLDSDELLTETSVAALSNMHELKLRITKRLSFLSPMTKLERLTLYSYQSSLDLTPLASLKNLRFLSFTSGNSFYDSYTTSLFNLGSLRGLPLEELVIENKSFYEPIDAVFEISTLRKLNLRGTSSEGTNYAKLKNLQQLQTLLMDGYREMRDVPPGEYERFWSYETVPASAFGSYLGELTGLQVLAASDCGLEAIDFVRQMPKLNYLDIANNAVTDLSPLAELKQLKYVRLTGNPVADYAPVDGRRDMTVIR